MRFIIAILFLLLLDYYAFQAFVTISETWSEESQKALFGLYWAVPAFIVLAGAIAVFNIGKGWGRGLISRVRIFTILNYLAKFLIILILLVDELRMLVLHVYQAITETGTGEIQRSFFLSSIAVWTGLIPCVILIYGMLRNRYRYRVIMNKVAIDSLPDELEGMKIVQISDIHSGSFAPDAPLQKAIDLINKQQADLVFFTGDLVNNVAREMYPFIDVFKNIKAKYGVYSITGNHDYGDYVRWESMEAKQNNFTELIETHRKLGWNLLLNENRILNINGESVAIIGVENFSASQRFSKYGDLSRAYQGAESARLKLLLSHDPSHWKYEVVKHFKDIAITFSGHTHGMQFGVEIPGWIKWSPVKYVYKQWAGLYNSGKQYLYVNRGFGFLGYPGRVGILPEITVLELKRR